jgi:hypothetical protein
MINFGVSIKAFHDFFVNDQQSYSIVPAQEFKGKESYLVLKEFVKGNMESSCTHSKILVTCSCI